jgi:hypothetical protein
MNKDRIEYRIRLKRPHIALECDYGSGRKAAINLMCLSCMGGSISGVSGCKSYSCPLWRFRPNPLSVNRPKDIIPSKEELEILIKKAENK